MQSVLICIADDPLRLACSSLLRREGYRVVEAIDLALAKELVVAHAPSLIVSGVLADPDDELRALADQLGVKYARVGPDVGIGSLLIFLDKYHLDIHP